MQADALRDSYRRLVEARGEVIQIDRGGSRYEMTAFVSRLNPVDVAGVIAQNMRFAMVLADDLARTSFPIPLKPKQDRFVWNGKTLTIVDIDDGSRRVQGETVAYVLTLAGA